MKPVCSYPECPWRFNEEEHWPICAHVNGHPHTNEPTHQHKPRRSQMQNPPIVALLCPSMHDMIDNGTKFKDKVEQWNGHRYYRLWNPKDEHKPDGWALVWKEIPDVMSNRAPDSLAAIREPDPVLVPGLQDGPDSVNRVRLGGARDLGEGLSEGPGWQELDFGPDYLNLPEEFTLQDAVPWAAMVGKWEHGRQWYAGDLLLGCEARFGHERLWGQSMLEDGKTFVDLLGMTYASLRNCQRVCEAFSPGERYPLSFGHHAAVYKHPERDRLMTQATAEGWTVAQLRRAVAGGTVTETCICPTCGKEHRKASQ